MKEGVAGVILHPGLEPGVGSVAALDLVALVVVVLVEMLTVGTQFSLRSQLSLIKLLAFFTVIVDFLLAQPAGGWYTVLMRACWSLQ